MSENMLIGYYSCLVANHMVYILQMALWVFVPALVHLREVGREDTTCSTWQKLEVSKWHQRTPGLSAGGAEAFESHKSLGHLHRAASFITCPTTRPGCTPGKGDGGKKKVLCTHGHCLHSSAWQVLFPLLRLIQAWSFLAFQKAGFAKYNLNTILLFYSSWSTKEMRSLGILSLPVLGLPDTSLVPATAEDTGLLWTHNGELYCMA